MRLLLGLGKTKNSGSEMMESKSAALRNDLPECFQETAVEVGAEVDGKTMATDITTVTESLKVLECVAAAEACRLVGPRSARN